MANRPNMGYSSTQANEMLMGLPGAMATETGRMLKATKTGIGNWWDSLDNTSKAATVAGLVPGIGDVVGVANDARLYAENPEMRTPANFGLSALGLLPFVPGMGTIKGIGKGLEKSALPVEQGVVKAVKQSSKNFLPKDFYPSIDGHNPLHAVMDWAKVRRLMHAARRGEDIPPILVDAYTNGNMLTGTHRAAAKKILTKLGDDVAASRIGTITPDDLDLPDDVREMLNEAIDNSDFGLIDELIDSGTMDMTAQDVLAQESKGLVPPVKRVAPQDEALRLAQERAALPVEQGGLGLPVDNTPEQRAMAMGFDTPTYQGRVMDDVPNNEMPKAVRGGSVGHAYTTDNPDVSSSYAMTSTPTNSIENIELAKLIKGYSPTNYPLLVRSGRQLTEKNDIYDIISPADLADNLSQYTDKLDYREFLNDKDLKEVLNGVLDMFIPEYSEKSMPKNLSRLFGFLEENPEYKKGLHQKFDSLIYNDLESGGKTIVPFDKDNIRSRFAAFDPYRKSAAIAAAMGVAAPDLMADEKQKPAKKNIVPPVKKQGK